MYERQLRSLAYPLIITRLENYHKEKYTYVVKDVWNTSIFWLHRGRGTSFWKPYNSLIVYTSAHTLDVIFIYLKPVYCFMYVNCLCVLFLINHVVFTFLFFNSETVLFFSNTYMVVDLTTSRSVNLHTIQHYTLQENYTSLVNKFNQKVRMIMKNTVDIYVWWVWKWLLA